MSSSNTMIYGFSIIAAAVLGFGAMYAAENIYPLSGGNVPNPEPATVTAPAPPPATTPAPPPATAPAPHFRFTRPPAPPPPATAPAPATATATATAPNLPPLKEGEDFAGGSHGLQHSGGFTFPNQPFS